MAKTNRTVRMDAETLERLRDLSKLLKEDEPVIIKRAIDMLYGKRNEIFEADLEERRRLLNMPEK